MPDVSAKQITAAQTFFRKVCPSLGTALNEQLNSEATVDLLDVRVVSLAELLERQDHVLQTLFTFSHPEGSERVFLVPEETARLYVDLMEGISGADSTEPLTDANIDTLTAGMTGLVRGFSLGLHELTGDHYDIESSSTHTGALTVPPVFALDGNAVEVQFAISIPDLPDTVLTGLFTATLVLDLLPPGDIRPAAEAAADETEPLSEDDVAAMLSEAIGDDFGEESGSASRLGVGGQGSIPFADLSGRTADMIHPRGLEMILDIPLDVTVELGRVRMLIKDVLELSSGSIIELDRVAGEPVDLLVNGRLVAKGEVVVIEDNFGIRITEIVSPAERVAGLGRGDRR